ncbi:MULTISPECIES: hypothetical protein [Paenibacillus]|uniref:Uncharacterized protein n=1 Tax=Paenibacillus campinasensis TaxID=66347 RepID=A0A268EY67_9BACL|nr:MULTISPECIES: hypothetical protein [Paenibacillus]MUG65338.1 hypothetical protein [Paenibacillus campinasensis]PAD78072.1 hypothetical protein CHH67_07505 [Paenibacillus campinasensis]PAK49524.1 hypothetical protein CHH75_20245 [Paenibacillus sp. 7541]
MKLRFNEWDLGGKFIFIASGIALISLFFNWLDIGIATENGFAQGGVFFFLCFIYPLVQVLRDKPLNKLVGYILALLAVIFTAMFVNSKTVDFFGETVRGAGAGPYLFMVACGLLTFGIFRRRL